MVTRILEILSYKKGYKYQIFKILPFVFSKWWKLERNGIQLLNESLRTRLSTSMLNEKIQKYKYNFKFKIKKEFFQFFQY